jgi:aspartyl-tRNA(Asn)/glutamyl-tRNA(Gln) amidotransferase subunit C
MSEAINENDVRRISHLARLKPSDDEVRLFAGQLSDILAYVDQLNEVDTTDVPPTAHALALHNVLRDDEPRPSLEPDAALANAPQRDDNFFAVPKVLDQDTGA